MGYGSLWAPQDPDFWVMAVCVHELGKLGITMENANEFLETSAGADFLIQPQNARLLKTQPGMIVFVPYGWCAMPLLSPAVKANTQVEETIGTIIVQALFCRKWADAAPSFPTLARLNVEYLKSKRSKHQMFQDRLDCLQNFCDVE